MRVEVRGRRDGAHEVSVVGVTEPTAVARRAVAATAAAWTIAGRVPRRAPRAWPQLVEPRAFLADLMDRGIRVFSFDGRPRRVV